MIEQSKIKTLEEAVEEETARLYVLSEGLQEEIDKEENEKVKGYLITSLEGLKVIIEERKALITEKWTRKNK